MKEIVLENIYNVMWPSLESDINLISQKYKPVQRVATVKNGISTANDNEAIQEILSIIRKIDNLPSFPITVDSSIYKPLRHTNLDDCTLYSTVIISSLGNDKKAALNAIHQFSSIDVSRIPDLIKYHVKNFAYIITALTLSFINGKGNV